MDIPFPSQLQWVTPLVGSHWPQGSESAWWRTAGYLRDAAAELEAQIPDLTKVRSKTHAALVGETAQAAEQQFAQLFAGNTAVDKLVEALRSLADAAETLGTEIQYTKLSIYSMLVIAAASIIFMLANSEWSLGASLAQIPVIRWLTENAMTRLVTMVLGRIEAELAARLGSMLVARLLVEGAVSAGIGAVQEGGIEAIQVAEGHRDGIDVGTVLHSALSMGAAGVAGGLAGHEVGGLLGTEGSTAMRALKGAVTGLASGEAANMAGTLVGGGNVGADTFLGGAIGVVHGGLGGAGDHSASVPDPTETAVPANASDTHPTLRFEKQPDGTFAWPGEQAGAVGDPSGSTSDGAPQAIAAPLTTPAADPAGAAGDRATGSPPASTAGEAATGSPGANGSPGASDSAAKTSNASTATAPSAHAEAASASPGSVTATPSAPDTAASPAAYPTAVVDPAPATDAARGSGIQEGSLDLSPPPQALSVAPVANAGSPAVSDLVGQSRAVGVPAGTPGMPRASAPDPTSTAPASSERGSSVGPPNPTPDARAGLAESSASGQSAAQPAGAPAPRTSDTTAARAGPGSPHSGSERAEAGQAGGSILERPAPPIGPEPPGQAGRPGADAHLVDRGEGARGDSGRTADPLTTRRDPTRQNSSRDDSNRPAGARPRKLPRRSGVARDTPEDLQPAAAPRARDLTTATEDIGVIKASHDDGSPGARDPTSNKGGSDRSDDTPDPGTAGGGAGDHRGGGGGDSGNGGGTGDDAAGPGDSSSDDFARAQQEYRAQDHATRRLDSRYAEPLGEVLDSRDPQRVDQAAEDLSGRCGQLELQLEGAVEDRDGFTEGDLDPIQLNGVIGTVNTFVGDILHGGEPVGIVRWYSYRDGERKMVVAFQAVEIFDEYEHLRGTGLARWMWELKRYFERVGLDRIRFTAANDGSLAWARQGTWDPEQDLLPHSLDNIKRIGGRLLPRVGDEARAVLVEFMQRLQPGHPDLPEPIDVLKLAAPGEPDLGRQLLKLGGAVWFGVVYLRGHPPGGAE